MDTGCDGGEVAQTQNRRPRRRFNADCVNATSTQPSEPMVTKVTRMWHDKLDFRGKQASRKPNSVRVGRAGWGGVQACGSGEPAKTLSGRLSKTPPPNATVVTGHAAHTHTRKHTTNTSSRESWEQRGEGSGGRGGQCTGTKGRGG